jgi:hypothetical protein
MVVIIPVVHNTSGTTQAAFNCQTLLHSFSFEYFRSFLVVVLWMLLLLEIATSITYATTTTTTTTQICASFSSLSSHPTLSAHKATSLQQAHAHPPMHTLWSPFSSNVNTRFSFPYRQVLFNKTSGDELSNRQTFVKGKTRHFSSKKCPDRLCGPRNLLLNGYQRGFRRG